MEGFLALYFGGPDIAWQEYTRRAIATGLSPRSESSRPGATIEGLDDALRTFEIHEGQVGVLLFVADALASAFVTPHPADYRALHRSLLEDFYGELIHQYARLYDSATKIAPEVEESEVASLADLRTQLERMRAQWSEFQHLMAGGLLGQPVASQRIYQAGPFQLERFITSLKLSQENHIGEAIVRDDGTVEYLKTFRLSAHQVRRTYLLRCLATNNWNLAATATELRCTTDELIVRIARAGFEYLLHEHVIKTAQKRRRQ
jgi:hypothetical protein